MLVTSQNGLSLRYCLIFSRLFMVALSSFGLAYNGLELGEGDDFHHKCLCGEPNFD